MTVLRRSVDIDAELRDITRRIDQATTDAAAHTALALELRDERDQLLDQRHQQG